MQIKWQYLIVFLLLFFLKFNLVLAENSSDNEKIEIKSGTNKFENLIFSVSQGKSYTSELLVTNKSNENLNLILYISPDEKASVVDSIKQKTGNDLFLNTFFYSDSPPESYQEELKNDDGEIAILCEKYKNSKDKAIKNWCKGERIVTLSIEKGKSKIIPFTINISEMAKEQKAFFIAILDENNKNQSNIILAKSQFIYKLPENKNDDKNKEKKELNINLNSFTFERSFSFFDFSKWLNLGRREEYLANFSVINNNDEDTSVKASIKTKYFSSEENYETQFLANKGENQVDLKVKMPLFGRVKITGYIQYGESENLKEIPINELEIFVFPVREILFIIFLLFTTLFLLWQRKKSLTNILDGKEWVKYKVQAGDNLVNLAFLYGVSWKELAKFNKIKPPYTLTPRSVIMIPPRLKKVFKHTFMQNKNYFEDEDKFSESNGLNENLVDSEKNLNLNSKDESIEQKKSFSASSNILKEESFPEKRSVPSNQMNNLNREKYQNYPERRSMDNIRAVDMRSQNSISPQQRMERNYNENLNQRSNEVENNPSFRQVRQENANKEVVILPKFITDKTQNNNLSNGNNNLMPVRRNMDIRWMHEDNDEVYDDAMYDEVRAINFKIKIILLAVIVLVGLSGYWLFNYFKNNNSKEETASINDLLSQNSKDDNKQEENKVDESKLEGKDDSTKQNNQDDENKESGDDSTKKEIVKLKDPKDIKVQVLNGGSKSGTATELTNLFKEKNYTTKIASNAKNNVDGIVIYYKKDLKNETEELSKFITGYNDVKLSEPDEDIEALLNNYNVDVIVVAGK